MRNILIIGAGKSSSSLVKYLQEKAALENLQIILADISLEDARKMAKNHQQTRVLKLDVFDDASREAAIAKADIVISMLPAQFHMQVAKDCLKYEKNLVTPSYVSEEMWELDEEVKEKNLIFMNEVGVDPGIDHMSAMSVIDRIRAKGGKMISFESFTGGLVAPESDNNLWNYKFTWNPRNVVTAGQGKAAEFIQEGQYKYIPYHRLFRRTEFIDIDGYGRFEALANRDSLKYRPIYGLEDIQTIYRGTLRRLGFSRGWNMFVQLGMTDDSYKMKNTEDMSYRDFVNSFLPYSPTDSVELKTRYNLNIEQDDIMWGKLEELDLFNPDKKIGIKDATPAQALQKILEENWTLAPGEKDMVVMYNKFGYELNGEKKQIETTLVNIGDDQIYTAMAKTVGYPVGMVALRILNDEIKTPGVQRPINKEVYKPVLKELADYGIVFKEKENEYVGYNPNNVRR